MIAFRDNLPLIEHVNGMVKAFERDWLTQSLARAAAKAGYAQWWLSEHVAQSVTEYLRHQRDWNVLPVDQLNTAVKSALESIGYADVALHFVPNRPRVEVSLVDLARDADSGYELAFFEKLGRVIHELVVDQACEFELRGLDGCVRLITQRKTWGHACERLRTEIINFARLQTLLAAGEKEVSFALA
jgi:hypothetical protein